MTTKEKAKSERIKRFRQDLRRIVRLAEESKDIAILLAAKAALEG